VIHVLAAGFISHQLGFGRFHNYEITPPNLADQSTGYMHKRVAALGAE
jgi:hypothetical protein